VLEEAEQVVDSGEEGRRSPQHGRRCWRGHGVVVPAVLREQLVHKAPEQRVEREVPLHPQHGRAVRPPSPRGRRHRAVSTLKSSRSRLRGSAAAGSPGAGMVASRRSGWEALENGMPAFGTTTRGLRTEQGTRNGTGRDGTDGKRSQRNEPTTARFRSVFLFFVVIKRSEFFLNFVPNS
jgi:hypothetical protein